MTSIDIEIRPAGMTLERALEIARSVYGGSERTLGEVALRNRRRKAVLGAHDEGMSDAAIAAELGYDLADVRLIRLRARRASNSPDEYDFRQETLEAGVRAVNANGEYDGDAAALLGISVKSARDMRLALGLPASPQKW